MIIISEGGRKQDRDWPLVLGLALPSFGFGVGPSFSWVGVDTSSWVGVGLFFGVRVGPSFSEPGRVWPGPDPKEVKARSSQEGENGKARGPAKRKGR